MPVVLQLVAYAWRLVENHERQWHLSPVSCLTLLVLGCLGNFDASLLAQTSQLPVVFPVAHQDSASSNPIPDTELQQNSWTLASLQDLALASHPAIRRSQARVGAARGNALQAGLAPNPNVGFDGQQLGSDGRAEQYGVFVGQEIVRREKLELDRAIAHYDVRRAESSLVATQVRLMTDVRIAFFRCLRAQQQVELTRDLLDLSSKSLDTSTALLSAVEVGRIDVLHAELEVESAESLLRSAENRLRSNWQQLAAVTAQHYLPGRSLDGELFQPAAEVDFEQTLDRLQQESPEVAMALASIERARCYLLRQQLEPRPNVTVEGLFNWRDNGINGESDGGLVVSIPLPLHNRNQGAIAAAHHGIVAAEQELDRLLFDLRRRLASVFERYMSARDQADRYRQRILPKSAETLELTREMFGLGEISFANLLDAQRTDAHNQLSYLEILETLRVAEAEIEGLLLNNSPSGLVR